jgi:hypothetical protein
MPPFGRGEACAWPNGTCTNGHCLTTLKTITLEIVDSVAVEPWVGVSKPYHQGH